MKISADTELLHHFLHLFKLLKKLIYVRYLRAASGSDTPLAGGVDDRGLCPFRFSHGRDHCLNADKLPVIDVGIFQLAAHAGEHADNGFQGAHFLDLPQLFQQVVHVEAVFLQLLRHFLGIFLADGVFRLFDQRQHIAHAQNAGSHSLGVELFEFVQLFAHTHILNGLTGDCQHGQCRTAAGVGVQLGHQHAVNAQCIIKCLCHVDGILTCHGIDHQPLAAEVGVLPRVHGTGLFTRGQTQVLTVATLGPVSDSQKLDGLDEETSKRYMHQYNFPSYSVGETKPSRGPGRREIGHGALAERALIPVLPTVEEFPYAMRLVSEVLSSNGSTSQASICGSTLALMDAGVPIHAPVAGISCGLITLPNSDEFKTMVDIQGLEDFYGDMDFKVGGTKKGITAIQMDLKNDGLTMEIIKNALDITYDARCEILDQIMLPCIAEPRKEVSKYAPKMVIMHINPDNIRDVIGKGGSVIQKIVADTGAKIDIDDDGTIHIAAADASACDAAKKCIDDIVFVPEIGKLYYGRVVRLMTFGAFVELAPGKDGLVHISKLADHRIEKVEDACKIGDMMWVKVTDIDEKGRVNLSHKDAMREIAAKEANGERVK